MSAGCGHSVAFDGASTGYRRALWTVIGLNATMFVVEMAGGAFAGSQALWADALDFLADSLTYGISLWAIGRAPMLRARVALAKGLSLLVMGAWVLGSTLWLFFGPGLPRAEIMGSIGFLALLANLASVVILMRYSEGDANVRSVWLCSRNDAIGNVAVIAAAVMVGLTMTPWPDLVVALAMAGLFLSSAVQILRRALAEMRQTAAPGLVPQPAPRDCGGHEGHQHHHP